MATIGCPCTKGGMRDNGEEKENEFYAICDKNFWEFHNNTDDFKFKDDFMDKVEFEVWCCPNCGRLIVFDRRNSNNFFAVFKPETINNEDFKKALKEPAIEE